MASSLILYLFCYESGNLSNDNRKKTRAGEIYFSNGEVQQVPRAVRE